LVDLQGKASAIAAPAKPYEQARFAPDGRRLVVTVAGEGAGREIHVYELAQERMSLAASRVEGASPEEVFKPIAGIVWSPDGKTLAINGTVRRRGLNLFLIAADGTEVVERLTEGPGYQFPEEWSRDGQRLLFTDLDPPRPRSFGIFEWNRENGDVRTVLDPDGARVRSDGQPRDFLGSPPSGAFSSSPFVAV
jgi:Tol biopolymer transport system component